MGNNISTEDLIIYIILPSIGLFILFTLLIWIWYKYCRKKTGDDDGLNDPLLRRNSSSIEINNRSYSISGLNVDDDIIEDVSLVERVKYAQQIHSNELRESAFIYLQFYLRSNKHKNYEFIEHLPIIGSRLDKNWFLMKQIYVDQAHKNALVKLKMLSLYKKAKITPSTSARTFITTQEQAKLVNELFISLKHPFLLTYDLVHYDLSQAYALLISGYSKDGSLKDLIYNSKTPISEWTVKYQYKTNGIKDMKKIKLYLKQILSAMLYLKFRLVPPITDLHSGNIIMANEKKACLLAGYENCFLGVDGRICEIFKKSAKKLANYSLITNAYKKYDELSQIKEVLCVGHLVYEMCAGCELSGLTPLPNDYQRLEKFRNFKDSEQIIKFLNYIFYNEVNNESSGKHQVPNIEQIFKFEFFNDVSSNDLLGDNNNNRQQQTSDFNTITQSNDLKSFVDFVVSKYKQNGKQIGTSSKVSKKKSVDLSATANNSQPTTTVSQALVAPTPPPPPPVSGLGQSSAPPPPPPPPPSSAKVTTVNETTATSAPSSDRNALLDSIRGGAKLKKTKTNDKSKPKIR